jgi:hypothetical protein
MSAAVRVTLLLILGLVVLGRGLLYLDDRLASAGRPAPVSAPAPAPGSAGASSPSAAAPAPVVPRVLPPPTESQLLALRLGDPAARADALRDLRAHAVTPELLEALDDVMRQADIQYAPEVVRLVACHRARADGATLDVAFAGLPAEPWDVAWHHEGAACLVDVIAARAGEDPARATVVLAERAIHDPTPRVREGLARLDLPALPEAIAAAADDRGPAGRRHRVHAVEAAIAMDAVRKWPDRVHAWVEDPEGLISATVVRALAARTDEASQAIVALEIATRPETGYLKALADQALLKPGTLDLGLASVAADPRHPAFARGNAALLVARQGGEEACRRLARIDATDAAIRPDLDVAFASIDRRFGPKLRAEARR